MVTKIDIDFHLFSVFTMGSVSGSSKQELDLIINTYFGSHSFDIIINRDDFEGKTRPNLILIHSVQVTKLKNV